ncbi:MAG: hypothetical protein WC979_00920 [Candidatus Pacearchaeota archaeon]|jgi:hypothetical protein|nr:hypothetical protein [Clostridia bacterium]
MAKKTTEDAAKAIIDAAESVEQINTQVTSLGNINEIKKNFNGAGQPIISNESPLGESKNIAGELGYKAIPLESLPSQGLFYPVGTKLFIKAASGYEIKHWSTIEEEDGYSIDDMLNFIVERCIKLTIPGKRASFKDLKDIDRFWLIFAIREYTFKDGENKLFADIPSGEKTERVEVTKDIINYYDPSDKMMRFYNEETRSFVFNLKNGEVVNLYFPNVGVSSFLKDYRRLNELQRTTIDEDFARYAIFLFEDWRMLTADTYKQEEQKSFGWSISKISLLSKFVDLVKESVNPSMTVEIGAGEVTVPLNFRGGIKAIFLISDILDELE